MPFSQRYREEHNDEPVQRELDDFYAHMKGFLTREHTHDGSHTFGLPVGGHSGESSAGYPQINLNSQSFINSLSPGFVQMVKYALLSGQLNDSVLHSINNGDVVLSNGILKAQSFELSELQIESMNATPVQLIASPGPNRWINPILVSMTVDVTDAYTNNPTFNLVYNGSTTSINQAFSVSLNALAVQRIFGVRTSQISFLQSTFDVRDKAVMARLSLTPSGVGAATMRGMVFYTVNTHTD